MTALLLLALADTGSTATSSAFPAPVYAHDLGKLTREQARALDGKAVRVEYLALGFANLGNRHGAGRELPPIIDAASDHDLVCQVRYAGRHPVRDLRIKRRHVVDGVLRVRYLPKKAIGGETFPGTYCVDVWDAVPVR